MLNRINYVPSDKVLVIPRYYKNKIINIGTGAIRGFSSIETVYIPETIERIYSNNFNACANLRTIFYAGTEAQWETLMNQEFSFSVPVGVQVIFNTPFRV